jgi:3D-(3,5/4)-trihydroxycyclohexane-1,2-dione acylhydrolase (decyclizing)
MIDGEEAPLFPGVFAIFGHGNVTGLGFALDEARDELPTIRGQNEQGMALAAVAYAKAMRRRQIMVATSSIGPGATNMVTAAGVAMANRLPVLLLSGDTFQSRIPDPVLQQVEHFGAPSTTVNDAFRAVTRYWDRITHPAQIAQSLPLAVETMLDPADCGPAFLGLPQDVQAQAYDFPARLFEPRVHELRRARPDARELAASAAALRGAKRPLVIAGGGVHYSLAEDSLRTFVETHSLPVVETVAGKSSLAADHPCYVGPIGVTGCDHANRLAADADVVLCVGTRLQDFTTGSWTVFGDATLIGLNAARFDAAKHRAQPLVGDVAAGLEELEAVLGDWRAEPGWTEQARGEAEAFKQFVAETTAPADGLPTYAQVIGAVNRLAGADDYALTAAGGFPGELNVNWLAKDVATFDCEYGFSCMGYEISGAWGARLARRTGDVIAFVGDGSYLMMNSDLYSSVITGQKLIAVVCDNGGFAVIDRLQTNMGGRSFNNMFENTGVERVTVDWVAHAQALGCRAEAVDSIGGLEDAFARARGNDRTTVIAIETAPDQWTPGGAFWEVGVAEVSDRAEIAAAHKELVAEKQRQRVGW